jgi:CelD/BcsL family acetyltransferase involved in cellulose biosynthesis
LQRLSLDDASWRRFVESRSDATPFHLPEWAGVLADCYALSGLVLVETDRTGSITAGLPLLAPPRVPGRTRRLVSLPYTDAVAPLVDTGAEAELAAAIEAELAELSVAGVDIRGDLHGAKASEPHAVIHTLALTPDPEAILAAMTKGKRRDVRAAQRNDLTLRRGESERDLTEVYFGLHLETRRRLGVPSQPKRFFRLLWQRLIEPGHGFVLLVEESRVPVAGAVFLTANGTIVYKFSASATKRRSQLPNDLLIWSAIAESCEEGFTTFDFGRSDLFAQGLREFKTRWGAVERPLVYSSIGQQGLDEARRTPGKVAAVLRRAPTWVTRAAGELLYRYAA